MNFDIRWFFYSELFKNQVYCASYEIGINYISYFIAARKK